MFAPLKQPQMMYEGMDVVVLPSMKQVSGQEIQFVHPDPCRMKDQDEDSSIQEYFSSVTKLPPESGSSRFFKRYLQTC